MALTIASAVKLSSGYTFPRLGFGVYLAEDAYTSTLAALRHGYQHIDTAQFYNNEDQVGRAIKTWSAETGKSREDVFITSKVADNPDGYNSALKVVEDSLEKLGTSYIDLYLIHHPLAGKVKRLETYRALLDKQKEGKIRSVGVSNFNVKHIEEIREAGYPTPTVNQIELHPLCQQKPIVDYCKEHDIVVSAYCPIIRGDFSNPVIQEISTKLNRTPAQVLVRWSLQKGFVPLPKSNNEQRIVDNANLYDFELSDEDMQKLDALDKGKDGAISWNPVDAE